MPTPPNVILILADDMGLGDLSCLNEGRSRTPRLDQLKGQSAWFPHAYSASPVCAPARAALLTGRYPHRTGVVTLNMETYPDLTRLRRDEVTLADMFKAHGYATGLVGKWHCGTGSQCHPLVRGFDEFEGFIGVRDVPGYVDYRLEVQAEMHEVEGGYLTDDLSERAVGFVRRHRDEPFFLHLAHYAPHRPLEAPEEAIAPYLDRGFDRDTATVYAMIEIMDSGLGHLMDELETLGLAENTLVVFSSDNGPDPFVAERFNCGLRDGKYTVYEGGIHVPFLVRGPCIEPGDRDETIHFTDVVPSLLELCGLPLPDDVSLDGTSFAGVLGEGEPPEPRTRFWQWNRAAPRYSHNAAVRDGDWKLVRPFVTHGLPEGDSSEPAALYDLSSDPAEAADASGEHPERVARMSAELEGWCDEVEADRLRPVRIPGPRCQASAPAPNILFVLVDDLGWADLGCYGHAWHQTPALDSLAADGVRFTQAYAPAPICSASRAAILTGQTPARLDLEFVVKPPDLVQQGVPAGQTLQTPPFTNDLPLTERLIPAHLEEAGYSTAFMGKWHVNQHYRQYLGWHPTYGPHRRGFQYAVEDFGSHPYSYTKGGEPEPITEDGVFPPDGVTDGAIDFLRRRDRGAPFFLMVSHFFVHTPIRTPCQWLLDKYEALVPPDAPRREDRVAYAAFVEMLDHYVGQLLGALDEEGDRDDTLVVFMSDNGGHPLYTGHAPLRGSKWNLYEGGIRVPLLARWPGRAPAGALCETPVHGCDLFPTFAEVAGHAVGAPGEGLDGVSLIPLLETPGQPLPARDLYWHFPYYHPEKGFETKQAEIGISDFAVSQTHPHSALRRDDEKLVQFHENGRAELYDLGEDPGEQRDRSQSEARRARDLAEELGRRLHQVEARFPTPREDSA